MLIKSHSLKGYTLKCVDGEIGEIKDFIFDEKHWTIRYLVAETGSWLMERQVLISPYSLVSTDADKKQITTTLTVNQIESSPPLYKDSSISREFEASYHNFYNYPTYWNGSYRWGESPAMLLNSAAYKEALGEKDLDPGLHSANNFRGRKISATDTEFGDIVDFVIDDECWAIRYIIIDTISWWPSPHVLISPEWIESIGEFDFKVHVKVDAETIKSAPEYTNEVELNRDYEECLHNHYGCTKYWESQPCVKDNEDEG